MDIAQHNRGAFSAARIVGDYGAQFVSATGFLDAGERAALLWVAEVCRGRPILDVGVGAGRTTGMLRLLSDRYLAVDYSSAMLDEFRTHHPGIEAECLDARDLTALSGRDFGLIMFSNNGIDSLAHDDRIVALAQFADHLEHDGRIVFSTLNRYGPSFGEHPGQLHRPTRPIDRSPRAIATAVARRVLRPGSLVRAIRNWHAADAARTDNGQWAIGPLAAHDYGLIVHFTTLDDITASLTAAGLRAEAIFATDGRLLHAGDETTGVDNFTVVAAHLDG